MEFGIFFLAMLGTNALLFLFARRRNPRMRQARMSAALKTYINSREFTRTERFGR